MIRGTTITLGDRKYLLPPASWSALKKHEDFIRKATTGTLDPTKFTGDELDIIFDIILSSLKRNYPDMTEEQLGGFVDMGNMNELFSIAMKTSGFETAVAGEPGPASIQTSTG